MKAGVVRGTFQILHAGHVTLLKQARNLVDHLYVFIDCDERVVQLKGECHVPANERKFILESLKNVDGVYIFKDEAEFQRLINSQFYGYKDGLFYFKGGDYRPNDLPEFDWLTKNGWTVCCLGHSGHSTSKLIHDIRSSNGYVYA